MPLPKGWRRWDAEAHTGLQEHLNFAGNSCMTQTRNPVTELKLPWNCPRQNDLLQIITDLSMCLKIVSYSRTLFCKSELLENQGVQYRYWDKTGWCSVMENPLGQEHHQMMDSKKCWWWFATAQHFTRASKKERRSGKTDMGTLFQSTSKTWEQPSFHQKGGLDEGTHVHQSGEHHISV